MSVADAEELVGFDVQEPATLPDEVRFYSRHIRKSARPQREPAVFT